MESLGSFVATRLPRSSPSVKVWTARSPTAQPSLNKLDAELVGLSEGEFDELGIEPAGDVQDLIYPDDLRVAARSVGNALPLVSLRGVIGRIKSMPSRDTRAIDELGDAFRPDVAGADPFAKPHVLGHSAAEWARSRFGVSEDSRVDIEGILLSLNVQVVDVDLEAPGIEAIAAWGTYGPTVLVNLAGMKSRYPAGRRATLAHELGHFIIDRDGALPVAEATGKVVKTPTKIEQRAGAFAAEFLLPRRVACSLLRRYGDVQITLEKLTSTYGVSKELALWQMRNHPDDAAGPSPAQRAEIKTELEELAKDRRRHGPSA